MSAPIVFISYSHDSSAHAERVRGLGASLARDGCECRIDAYKETDEDWPTWMSRQLVEADFVLCVVTETYERRFRDDELPDVGLGVGWEAGLIRRLLYKKKLRNDRIFPVVFAKTDRDCIPLELQGYDHFLLDGAAGYEALLRKVVNQPQHIRPAIGTTPNLGSSTSPPLFPRPGAPLTSTSKEDNRFVSAVVPPAQATRDPSRRLRIYISYSVRGENAEERARKLADRLRKEGFDVHIDIYYRKGLHGFTAPRLHRKGEDAWTRWQMEQIRDADRVILICTPEYASSPPNSGVARDLQFMWEDVERPGVELSKFIPVGFDSYEQNRAYIPDSLQGANYFNLAPGNRFGGLSDLIRQFQNEFGPRDSTGSSQPSALENTRRQAPPARGPKAQPTLKPIDSIRLMQPPIDFVVITPLEEEREAMLAHLGNPKRLPPSDDDIRVYYPATIPVTFTDGQTGKYKVVVTDLLGMGRLEAAHAVGDAVRRWKPKFVVLVGIAGGMAKAGVSLGDVLISEQIADYELQKFTAEKTETRWSVHRVSPALLAAARQVGVKDWQPFVHEQRPKDGNPKRHLGPICTGDKVIANGLMDQYREIWTKLIGVEMEAGGVASAAFQASSAPGFFMVRGVSDLADPAKDEGGTVSWRAYACDVAAAYVEAFLKSGPVLPVSRENSSSNP